MVTPINHAYVGMIKRFRGDCEVLLKRFEKEASNEMKDFLPLWESLNFDQLYDKEYSTQEMEQDFMKDTLQISKLIMLNDDFTAGMFLMYGLYCLQDCPKGSIRLQLNEFEYILKTLRSKEEDHTLKIKHELAWLFSVLLKGSAFEFVLFGREYDIEGQDRAHMIYKNQYDFSDDESPTFTKPKDWVRNFIKDIPKEMTDLESKYLKMKKLIKSVLPSLNLNLDMVQDDIATTLLRSVTLEDSMVEPGDPENTDNTDRPNPDNSIGARRKSLKARKMKTKHRSQQDATDFESAPDKPPSEMKKRGCPKGERKRFLNKVINKPDLDTSSDSGDSSLDPRPGKSQLCLPDLD